MKHIGKSYDKVDAKGILSGKPSYTGDFVPKDALIIKVLRSPHAQAKIKSIDTSKAKLIPGVEAIFTYEDVPNTRFTLAGQTYPEPSAYDALILDSVVRYVGDEVALIVAKDEATALKAMPLIKVEYEVQKPVLFVSHNRDEVYRLCSMVSCIDHGKMEVIEKTKEFFHNPKTKTAAVLSGCKNISAAEIVDNNHIKALGWGITLCVSEIPEETKAVGIRAHSFYPVNAEQIPGKESAANESRVSVIQEGTGLKKYRNPVQEENIFKIEESRIIEDPFEWNISFRPSKESGWLQWKIAKTEQGDSPGPIPPALAVHAKDILLLKDNAYE